MRALGRLMPALWGAVLLIAGCGPSVSTKELGTIEFEMPKLKEGTSTYQLPPPPPAPPGAPKFDPDKEPMR